MPENNEDHLKSLLEMDRFVRLMAVAPCIDGIVEAVRAYLASWSMERIDRLQSADKGWAPFDEWRRPYPVGCVEDVRQIAGSVRIRCRELEASGERISFELRELDLFCYFANESFEVHEPPAPRANWGLAHTPHFSRYCPDNQGRAAHEQHQGHRPH